MSKVINEMILFMKTKKIFFIFLMLVTAFCVSCMQSDQKKSDNSSALVKPKELPVASDLLAAVREQDTSKIALILEKVPSLADSKDSDGYPLLHIAIWQNNARIAKLLLVARANPDAKSPYGFTPLHETVRCDDSNDRKEILEMLIMRRADVNALTPSGNTPLDIAAVQEKQDFARVLRHYGAKRVKQTVDLPPVPPFAAKSDDLEETDSIDE